MLTVKCHVIGVLDTALKKRETDSKYVADLHCVYLQDE